MMNDGKPSIDDTNRRSARQLDRVNPSRIYLVRHGETAWSLTGQHTGKTDIALTQHGEEQAFALAPVLGAIEFSHVLTSPAVRALRTCKLAGFAAQAVTSADLAEWDYGDYEGKRSSDIHQFRPDWNVFQDGCPGGESVRDVTARADRVIASMRRLSGNALLFSHGQFGRSLAARWIGLAIVKAQHLQIDPASIGVLAHDPAHSEMAVIARWNDTTATMVHQPNASRNAMDAQI
jgi:broad specificity phosphatase PhoE